MIGIYSDGTIRIGYFDNGYVALGNYLRIFSDGRFEVGECYPNDKSYNISYIGTRYMTDGTSEPYDLWVIT